MTTPTGGTPATPPPPPHTAATTTASTPGRKIGLWLTAIAVLIGAFFLFVNDDTKITGASNNGDTPPTVTVTATPAPSTTVADPEAEVPPVVAPHDIASCGEIWTWTSFDTCVDKVATWMPAEIDKHREVSKIPYSDIEGWATRFPNADARVIFVYNDGNPVMSDEDVRAKAAAEAKLDPSVAARLPIVRVERDFPGWYVVNTGNLNAKRMDPFKDERPEQVRVSLAPLNEKGEVDLRMAGSGVFVTCFNLHWLQQDKPAVSTPPGTTTNCCTSTTSTTTTTPSTSTTTTQTTTTTPSTSTTTTTTSTTTTSTTTTQTSPPKNPDGGATTSIVMPPPPATDAETTTPPPSTQPLDPEIPTTDPTVDPPVTSTPAPPSVPSDLPSETVTTTVPDPGSAS